MRFHWLSEASSLKVRMVLYQLVSCSMRVFTALSTLGLRGAVVPPLQPATPILTIRPTSMTLSLKCTMQWCLQVMMFSCKCQNSKTYKQISPLKCRPLQSAALGGRPPSPPFPATSALICWSQSSLCISSMNSLIYFGITAASKNEKSAQRDANTAHWL